MTKDIPSDEEIKQYFEGVKTSTGLTFYDDTISGPRLQAMCPEGRQKIFDSLKKAVKKSDTGTIEDFDVELLNKSHVVYFSIPLGQLEASKPSRPSSSASAASAA